MRLAARLAAALLLLLPALAPAAQGSVPDQVLDSPAVAPAAGAWGLAVEGSDYARVRLPEGEVAVEAYANAGYALTLAAAEDGGREAVVEVDLAPLASAAPFVLRELAAGAEPGPVETLARELTAASASRYAAVSAVLGWMVHNVVGEETAARAEALAPAPADAVPASPEGAAKAPTAPRPAPPAPGGKPSEGKAGAEPGAKPPSGQAPEAVLARGDGSAAGIAGLAVALLGAAGIEARTVRGVVVGPPVVGSPHGDHTWIEVRYPRRRVFSDPLYHHHYVPATYLRLAPAGPAAADSGAAADTPPSSPPATAPGKAAAGEADGAGPASAAPRFELVARRDRRQTVDLYPAGAPGVTARKNDAAQEAGALRVVVAGAGRGSAVLEGAGGRRSKMLVAGESVFVGLPGGAYRLEVYLEGRPPIVRQVEVGPHERRAVFLRQADGGQGGQGSEQVRHDAGRRR